MSIFNCNVNTQNSNVADVNFGGVRRLVPGWYKVQLTSISEPKMTQKGDSYGSMFEFTVVDGEYAGCSFKRWFCVRALNTAVQWQYNNTENFMVRIAQCVGVQTFNNEEQLFNKPFFAQVRNQERKVKSIDSETGEQVEQTRVDVDFCVGALKNVLLSVVEYHNRFSQDRSFSNSTQFVKASSTSSSPDVPW